MMVLAVTLHNIPEGAIISMPFHSKGLSNIGTIMFMAGFSLMMVLDVALG